MKIQNTSTEMGTCEWLKPALHYFVMLSRYILVCGTIVTSMMLDHGIPAMFENVFTNQILHKFN